MTVKEAIATADEMRPNSLESAVKQKWLSDLEHRIYSEIYLTHENEDIPFTDFDSFGNETVLFAPPPYDELYTLQLCAMLDFYHAEYDRCNNDTKLFDSLYTAFARLWHAQHEPASQQVINR